MKLDQKIQLYEGNCLDLLPEIPDASIDAIITDPPYLYLKNGQCEFDKQFDERVFFSQARRTLKDDGFIVLFGRGSSFYRWNTRLADVGFIFKEEVIWNKKTLTSPFHRIGRYHESISIHTKRSGVIRRVKLPYIESRQYDIPLIMADLKKVSSAISNPKAMKDIERYLTTGDIYTQECVQRGYNITRSPKIKKPTSVVGVLNSMINGMKEKSVMDVTLEQSIIEESRDRNMQHPTQKPVRLIERLINLVTDKDSCVLDPFAGSGSTGIACINTGRRFIGIELMNKYFIIAQNRIQKFVA